MDLNTMEVLISIQALKDYVSLLDRIIESKNTPTADKDDMKITKMFALNALRKMECDYNEQR